MVKKKKEKIGECTASGRRRRAATAAVASECREEMSTASRLTLVEMFKQGIWIMVFG